jgi:DNA mismatch repair protein MutS2
MTPLDFIIEKDSPMLVISGLNAGGKTVALKTLGLNLLLAKTGLMPHSLEKGHMDFPDKILAVMGDNQDLSSDLSTFSGHVRALSKILNEAGPGVIILIDELGGGTDPQEGQALALSVLEHLKETGALVLTATHFHMVKSWAALTEGVVSVSVNTGEDGAPIYGLSYGAPGFSGGLHMAAKLGLPDFLIEKAKSYLDDNHKRSSELLKQLDEARASLLKEKDLAVKERISLEETKKELDISHKKEIDRLNREAREKQLKTNAALSRYRSDFEKLKEEVTEQLKAGEKPNLLKIQIKKAEMERELKEDIEDLIIQDEEPLLPAPKDLKPGDPVYIIKLRSHGQVLSWNPQKNEGTVESGSLIIKASLEDLSASNAKAVRRETTRRVPILSISQADPDDSNYLKPLVLIGCTVDEAVSIIEREIDQRILRGRSFLTIVHGHGTGRLRTGVQDYLSKHPKVKEFKSPINEPGGSGRTDVTLDV